ncbi:hypothetical protein AOLI_G00291360 [Acnodon oligacanthus]
MGGFSVPLRRHAEPHIGVDKRLDRGMTFNGSQRRSCSATHDTLAQNQVVYESFSTGFNTNLRCEIGEGAALFRPHPGPVTDGTAHRGPPCTAPVKLPTCHCPRSGSRPRAGGPGALDARSESPVWGSPPRLTGLVRKR